MVKVLTMSLSVFLLAGCIWAPPSHTVPHANIELAVPEGGSSEQLLDKAEVAILSLGFAKSPNDWERWRPILDAQELDIRKRERSYLKEAIRISYWPERESQYKRPLIIRLQYYEFDQARFSQAAIEGYDELCGKLRAAGIELPGVESGNQDRKPDHTPLAYNAGLPSKTLLGSIGELIPALISLVIYGCIVLWPGLHLASRIWLQDLAGPLYLGRAIFAVFSGLLLAPSPILLAAFGPVLLVPMPFAALWMQMFDRVPEWGVWSVAMTTLVAAAWSMWVYRDTAPLEVTGR